MKWKAPVVLYIDREALWKNLMNETPMSTSEISYRVREKINFGIVASLLNS